jgi:folate-binding protein YgfZ
VAQVALLDVAEGYARLRPGGGGAGVPAACEVAWVEGPDALGFLQGLVTNDVLGLPLGGSQRALLLTAKGRIQADLRVVRSAGEEVTLVVEPGAGEPLVAALERYHFSERVEILGPDAAALVTVGGLDGASAADAELVVDGLVPGTVDLVGDPTSILGALGVPEAPAEALEALRVEAGVPRLGRDMTTASLVHETGLERTVVSFTKGCYLGQETVARTEHRGRPNRQLRGLGLPAPAAPGAAVGDGGRALGAVTSPALSPRLGAIALAVLRREVEVGAQVEIEGLGAPGRVVGLPFPA